MSEHEIENFIAVDDEHFDVPPDEPRWGGTGPTDRNAEVIEDADQN